MDIRFLRPWARYLLSEEDDTQLILSFPTEDLKLVVFDIANDKAPGPDGFSSGFFKAAWSVVGIEVTKAVLDFFSTGKLLKQINCTFFALIPKIERGLDKLVSPCQAAFIPSRSTGDNIIVEIKCEDSHTFQPEFADDVLLFCRADLQSIRTFLKKGLDRFGNWSGLRVNVQKSHLILSRSTYGLKEHMLAVLGFQEGHLLMRYLGLPLISSCLSISICQPFIQKIDARIAGWEGLSLSYARRGHGVGGRYSVSGRGFVRWWSTVSTMGATFIYGRTHGTTLAPLIERLSRGPLILGLQESIMLNSVIGDGQWQWPPSTDMEFLEIVDTLPLIHGGSDRIIWRFSSGTPSTQDLYGLFDPPGPKVGWTSLLSGFLKIPRHMFILWLAILEKLPTTDKLWLSHLGICVLCDEDAMEAHTHLFFRCRYSRCCLAAIHRIVRLMWPNRDWATDISWAVRKWRGKHIIYMAYRALLESCVYHIWRERNTRCFDLTERNPTVLASLFVEDIKLRILSISLTYSVSTNAIYRLWRIAWLVKGEPNS
ncbi:UNVERIFIED_CONTAM: hypothetical protein Sindi_1645800 [Sesamum indicum]